MVDKNRQITAAAYRCIQTQQSNNPLLHSSSWILCLTLCAAGSNYFHRNASRVKWNEQNRRSGRCINQHFDESEILSYAPNRWKETGKLITEVLKDSDQLKVMAQKGQTKVIQEHTWDVRAKSLVEIAEAAIESI